MIIDCQRHLFDIPQDICYLNAAQMTPHSKKQTIAGQQSLNTAMHAWDITSEDFFSISIPIRNLSAELFNVSNNDIAIIPSASYGIATAAKNLPLGSGDAVLVLESQFPSNFYEWQLAANTAGGEILTVPEPSDHNWTQAIVDTIESNSDHIKIVAIPNVHWSTGTKIDLMVVSKACKKIGAALVLDLTQSAGALPIDLSAVDPDFAITASYKWMLGPYSMGVMYVAARHHQGLPLEQNWITRRDSDNFGGLVNYKDDYVPGAARFDMGEKANFVLSPIFSQALRQLLDWGIENIAETLTHINSDLASICKEAGFRPIRADMRSPNILGIDVDIDTKLIVSKLRENNVFISARGSRLRISPHVWINDTDIERFRNTLLKL